MPHSLWLKSIYRSCTTISWLDIVTFVQLFMQVSFFSIRTYLLIMHWWQKSRKCQRQKHIPWFSNLSKLAAQKVKISSPQKNLPDMDPPSYLDAAGPFPKQLWVPWHAACIFSQLAILCVSVWIIKQGQLACLAMKNILKRILK